jgi:hypothetical protein
MQKCDDNYVEVSKCNVHDFFWITTKKNEKQKIGLGYACALLVISNLKVTNSFIDVKNLNMGEFD